jgi:BMFP domain-containing protein YqiC
MSNNNFFEEMQKLTMSALNSFSGSAKHFEEMFKNTIESILAKMNLVQRSELEATQEIAKKALEKVTELENKISELEKNK